MLHCIWIVCWIAKNPPFLVQIAFQLTELFQTEIDAVIYTDQFTCYTGTWTRRLKFVFKLRLNIDSKQILNELFGIYGPQTISMRTVFRWVKAFKAREIFCWRWYKQWKRKDQKRPCIAKRTISSKKILYAIFFNSSGPVVQVPCPSGHTVTGRFYKNSVLKKVKEFYNKKRPSKGRSEVHLLHDNASSHKCEVVKSFFASEKMKVLNHPPYSPDLSPCDFFLFPRLKKILSGHKYTSRSSLGSAIYQCLQQIPK